MTSENISSIQIDKQAETVTFHTADLRAFQYRAGDIVGESYRLLNLIGQGGMGVVYRAKHIIIDQNYALKLLAPGQINVQSWRRFEVEGRSLARLNHENIVTIYNMGIDRHQCPYYVMEWLAGVSLGDRINRSGAVSLNEALPIFLQICAGLDCAHRNGIIHRDIKPANIMLVPSTRGELVVKIVDFGMARLSTRDGINNQALTASGEVFGSPLYMSPEQTLGQTTDARSDIYSLGCSLFETLSGRVPFRGQSAFETMTMHQETLPPALFSDHEDSAIEEVVTKCLRKDVNHRYQSIEELALDLEAIVRELNGDYHDFSNSAAENNSSSEIASESSFDSRSESSFDSQSNSSFGSVTESFWSLKSGFILIVMAFIAIGLAAAIGVMLIAKPPGTTSAKAITAAQPQTQDRVLPPVYEENNSGESTERTAVSKALAQEPLVSLGMHTISGGKKIKQFHLPEKIEIGALWSDSSHLSTSHGYVSYPADKPVTLGISQNIAAYPDFLSKIAPDDISTLRMRDIIPADPILKRIAKWRALGFLILDGCSIELPGLLCLNELQHLTHLAMKKVTFNTADFSRLAILRRLEWLAVENCTEVNELMQALPVMPRLHTLDLRGYKENWLTIKSLRAIARQKSIKTLKLETKRTALQDELGISDQPGITETVKSERLDMLHEDMIDVLAGMHLTSLWIDQPRWPRAKINTLLRKVPAARGNLWAKNYQ